MSSETLTYSEENILVKIDYEKKTLSPEIIDETVPVTPTMYHKAVSKAVQHVNEKEENQ